MTTALSSTLLTATLSTGLTAGFLAAFAHTVMPGLGKLDDASFVGAFQAMDKSVENPWFMVPFLMSPVLSLAALPLALADQQRQVSGLIAASLVLTLGTIGITGSVHLPLNRALQEVAQGTGALDLAAIRLRFEHRWVQWNVARTVTSVGAFAALSLALLRAR